MGVVGRGVGGEGRGHQTENEVERGDAQKSEAVDIAEVEFSREQEEGAE
jgi:hypothetical protein